MLRGEFMLITRDDLCVKFKDTSFDDIDYSMMKSDLIEAGMKFKLIIYTEYNRFRTLKNYFGMLGEVTGL